MIYLVKSLPSGSNVYCFLIYASGKLGGMHTSTNSTGTLQRTGPIHTVEFNANLCTRNQNGLNAYVERVGIIKDHVSEHLFYSEYMGFCVFLIDFA